MSDYTISVTGIRPGDVPWEPSRDIASMPETTKEERALKYFACIAAGADHKTASRAAHTDLHTVLKLCAEDPELHDHYKRALDVRDSLRKAIRDDAIHERAVKGTYKRVVSAGRDLGGEWVPSDRLLLRLHECDHPEFRAPAVKAEISVSANLGALFAQIEQGTGIDKPAVVPRAVLDLPTGKPFSLPKSREEAREEESDE